jgi:hypothetical protein
MKHLLLTLLLATLCATAYGQTIKSLGYDTASGEVIANTGTNTLTFTNAFNVATNAVAQVRTNLGLGGGDSPTFSGLTLEGATLNVDSIKGVNNEATQIDLGSGDFSSPSGTFIFTTDSDKLSVGTEIEFVGDNAATNATITRTNLGLGATWLTNTNVTNFRTAIGLGATNEVFFNTVEVDNFIISGSNQLTIPSLFLNGSIEWNEASDAATTRTNLGIPLPALTNTSNVTMMRALAGSTNTNQPHSGNLDVVGQLGNFTIVVSNGIIIDVTQ